MQVMKLIGIFILDNITKKLLLKHEHIVLHIEVVVKMMTIMIIVILMTMITMVITAAMAVITIIIITLI